MRYKKRKKAASRMTDAVIVVIAVIAVMLVLACSKVFAVRDIMVVGNRTLMQEEVITHSGVKKGDNILGITSDMLKKRLEQNRYIEYLGYGFDYRGTLTLKINERLGMAVVNVLGLYYVMDEEGMVLESAGRTYPAHVAGPQVTGFTLDMNSRVTVGELLPVQDKRKITEMGFVLHALDEANLLSRASELSVKNLDNLYVMTSDGAKIELGDSSGLLTKLLIAREVLSIREPAGDLKGAKIDVSGGKNAHYIPAVLPTVTPVPTATPTIAPSMTPKPEKK